MKVSLYVKTDLTWMEVEGSSTDFIKCQAWVDANQTQYVISSKRRFYDTLSLPHREISGDEFTRLLKLRMRTSVPQAFKATQRWGFKSPQDAMRFRLSMS